MCKINLLGENELSAFIQTERIDTDRDRNITILLYTTHYVKGTAKCDNYYNGFM